MAKENFLQETREDFEGSSLADLEGQAGDYLSLLVEDELGADWDVHEDLINFLALNVLIYEKRSEMAIDGYQRRAFEALKEQYAAIFRNSAATDQWAYTYCDEQVGYYLALEDGAMAEKWREIMGAMERVIRGKAGLGLD